MPENGHKPDSAGQGKLETEVFECPEAASPKTAYGCCFCVTGKEQRVVDNIRRLCPGVRAITARQEKHKTANGKKLKIEAVILPGYVFFEAPAGMEALVCIPREYILRILTVERGVWQLSGTDENFARWLFHYDGLLGFSKAYRENERIRIISGPLKDMEGQIARIDKRGRSGQVILEFNGRRVPVWLGFDVITEAGEEERGRAYAKEAKQAEEASG